MAVSDLIYGSMAPMYDAVCGALLQPGRRRAMSLLNPQPGELILEVGVGTGYGVNHYPDGCRVMAIDLSRPMLERATRRVDREHLDALAFAQMDATNLGFADGVFDAVYVPYTINVVPDPVAAGRELLRVSKPDARIVFVNHFDGIRATSNLINTAVGTLASVAGVNWKLSLDAFVSALNLRVINLESVNVPRLSSVVVCEKALA
ncbi:MAG TPA: methyltransferase domain-containing protein [Vicinamibacterales bacterium]